MLFIYTILWPGKLPQSILLNVIMLLCYYVITKKTFLFNHFFNNTT